MGGTIRLMTLILISIFLSVAQCAQEVKAPAKEENLYAKALFASMAEMEKQWGHIGDSSLNTGIRTNYHNMWVEKDAEITDSLPSQSGDFRVEYLDNGELIEKYKKLRKEFAVLRIHPMSSDGANLKISVSVYYVSYKKRRLMVGLSDWSDVLFRFDCETQEYVISSIKLGGI